MEKSLPPIRSVRYLMNLPEEINSLVCGLCSNVVWNRVSCQTCSKLYCSSCITLYVHKNKNCPCGNPFRSDPHLTYIDKQLESLLFRCPNRGCGKIVPYKETEKHIKQCTAVLASSTAHSSAKLKSTGAKSRHPSGVPPATSREIRKSREDWDKIYYYIKQYYFSSLQENFRQLLLLNINKLSYNSARDLTPSQEIHINNSEKESILHKHTIQGSPLPSATPLVSDQANTSTVKLIEEEKLPEPSTPSNLLNQPINYLLNSRTVDPKLPQTLLEKERENEISFSSEEHQDVFQTPSKGSTQLENLNKNMLLSEEDMEILPKKADLFTNLSLPEKRDIKIEKTQSTSFCNKLLEQFQEEDNKDLVRTPQSRGLEHTKTLGAENPDLVTVRLPKEMIEEFLCSLKKCSACKKHQLLASKRTCGRCKEYLMINYCDDCKIKKGIKEDSGVCCAICKTEVCSNCRSQCRKCLRIICNSCGNNCSGCSQIICKDCSPKNIAPCEHCKKLFCTACLDLCQNCKEMICNTECRRACTSCGAFYCTRANYCKSCHWSLTFDSQSDKIVKFYKEVIIIYKQMQHQR